MPPAASISARVAPGLREADVVGDGAVEQEVVLQHDAELATVVAQLEPRQVAAVHANHAGLRAVERHHQADQRALAGPARPHQRRRRARRRVERHALEHLDALDVREAHVLELHLAADRARSACAAGILLALGGHLAHFANAVEAGKRLADLRADRRDGHDRRRHQAGEEDVHHEVAERHLAGEDRAAADDDHQHADDADDDRGGRVRRPRRRSSS